MADVKESKKEEEKMEVVDDAPAKGDVTTEESETNASASEANANACETNASETNANASETKMNGSSHESGESKNDVEAMKKKANQLLLLGKRNILIRDFQAAIASLAECCQLSKEIYSEEADELADPYYYYGKALFEVARNESKVLGEQMQEDEGDDDDEEEEEEEGGGEEDEEEEDEDGQNGEGKGKGESNGDAKGENGKTEEDKVTATTGNEGETEEVNDLQLSWEFLELAKLIYQRKASRCKDSAVKLAEVYLTLGENGLESDNYRTAIEDIRHALELQRKTLPDEDRRIAETLYHLGVAHSLDRNFDEAVSNFESAIRQLEKKIASLEMRKREGARKTEDEERDAFYTMDGEIEDIRSVIKEIEEKIADMNDYKSQIKAELVRKVVSGSGEGAAGSSSSSSSSSNNHSESSAGGSGGTSTSTSTSSSSVPVTDISHLVRKKRKNDAEDGNEAKKAKQENGA